MQVKEGLGILPLESFGLSFLPWSTHNLAWSPDAELAVASDDSVYLFLPSYPAQLSESNTSKRTADQDRQFAEVTLRFPIVEKRRPELNKALFDYVNQDFPQLTPSPLLECGSGTLTSISSSMNHCVALEWSPNGLARMRRSVLAVLAGNGTLTIYGEGQSNDSASSKPRPGKPRSLASWVAPWSAGGDALIPRAPNHQATFKDEYVTSFAWARGLEDGKAMLAYMTDSKEVVLLAVQAKHDGSGIHNNPGKWRVEEIGRFPAYCPHPSGRSSDPDYTPSGSSFALRWSPWLHAEDGQSVAVLSYLGKNYVGFLHVSIDGAWEHMEAPSATITPLRSSGICLYLAPDAFITFEDVVSTAQDIKTCRGVIATPATVQAFQVALELPKEQQDIPPHPTSACKTTYPTAEDSRYGCNPIVGLILHSPSPGDASPSPHYSLARLSATNTNTDWFQTNLSLANIPDRPADFSRPQWLSEISQLVEKTLPLELAYLPSQAQAFDSEDEDEEGEETIDDSADQAALDPEADGAAFIGLSKVNLEDQIHTTRVRIWGMAASPGGGTTAVFISTHSAFRPERMLFGGIDCRILFGRDSKLNNGSAIAMGLSTEARAWEWMHGDGPPVEGLGPSDRQISQWEDLKASFQTIIHAQRCSLCDLSIQSEGKISRCAKGHIFYNCATTGLAILAPGTSHTCAVCGAKTLKLSEVLMAKPNLSNTVKERISEEICGGCGGKFIN